MSLTKRHLESQPEFYSSREELLETVIRDVTRAAHRINAIENLRELTMSDVQSLSLDLRLALETLQLMQRREEAADVY